MPRRTLLVVLSLVFTLSAACSFSYGPTYELDKANALVNEANTLTRDGSSLIAETTTKYQAIFDEAQKTEDWFEELAAQEGPLKKLEPQIQSAQTKLSDASKKFEEAAKLNVPDWFKQYLTTLSDQNRNSSEIAGLLLQVVKNTYDPSIETPEDLNAKNKDLQDKMAAINKKQDELKAAQTKLESENKDAFKK